MILECITPPRPRSVAAPYYKTPSSLLAIEPAAVHSAITYISVYCFE